MDGGGVAAEGRRRHGVKALWFALAAAAACAGVWRWSGAGWRSTGLIVVAVLVLAGWWAAFGDIPPGLVAKPDVRPPRITRVEDVTPVRPLDLADGRRAAWARLAAGIVTVLLAGAAKQGSPELVRSLASAPSIWGGLSALLGALDLWTLRRLGRRPLATVAVTVRAVDRPKTGQVLLVGPTLAWQARRQGLLADVVVGDVVVVHLDPATDNPAVITDGSRRGLVTYAAKAKPTEVDVILGGTSGG